jgi:hypothetical protein
MIVWTHQLQRGTTHSETRATAAYRSLLSFRERIKRAEVFDLLKSAPKWFLLLVIAASTAFGSASATMAGMVVIDSLSRIERNARDSWQQTLAEQAERLGKVESKTAQNTDELYRRAQADAEFRAEMRREFDRLNFRLTQKGR